jgi:hypothetical protein
MDMRTSRAIEKEIKKGHMVLRPGWVRLNFNYFIDEATFDYLLSAVELIANYGAGLLPYYEFDSTSATWRYQGRAMQLGLPLEDFDFAADAAVGSNGKARQPAYEPSSDLPLFLAQAREELTRNDREGTRYSVSLPASVEALRWFALPQEVYLQNFHSAVSSG